MTLSEELSLLEKRKDGFEEFYKALIPALVEFIGNLGISPPHEVLRHATQYSQNLDDALRDMAVASPQDRSWLITRVGCFIGEYFAQKYSGCWFVNDIPGSRYFSRYVVGRFAHLQPNANMLDPFLIAQTYVDTAPPRQLESLLTAVDAELATTRSDSCQQSAPNYRSRTTAITSLS